MASRSEVDAGRNEKIVRKKSQGNGMMTVREGAEKSRYKNINVRK
jgi:hypothetical protein